MSWVRFLKSSIKKKPFRALLRLLHHVRFFLIFVGATISLNVSEVMLFAYLAALYFVYRYAYELKTLKEEDHEKPDS